MSHVEAPDFDRLTESREVLHEARQDRDEIKRLRSALAGIRLYCSDHAFGGWRHDIAAMVDLALTRP